MTFLGTHQSEDNMVLHRETVDLEMWNLLSVTWFLDSINHITWYLKTARKMLVRRPLIVGDSGRLQSDASLSWCDAVASTKVLFFGHTNISSDGP